MSLYPRNTRLCVVFLFALGACGGARGAPAALPLDSKARGAADRMIVRHSEAPVVELRVVYEAGSADDPSGQEGVTLVTALSMLEGKAGPLSFAERERALFPMAARIDAHVDREQVTFVGRVHRDHLAAFYPLFRDVLVAPAFEAADFDRVRARARSQLTQDLRGADDEALGKEVLAQMLFEGHPYAHPELGTERGLDALTPAHLRAQWSRVLCPRRVRVALSGAVTPALEQAIATDLIAASSGGCEAPRALPPPSSLGTRRVWIVDKPEAISVAISMGLPIEVTRRHPDFAALALATAYLGQHRTFAGKLMQTMRGDRGLNYGDYAYVEHFVQDGQTRFPRPNVARRQQYFSVWLRPVRVEHARFSLRMALRELERFATDGLSQDDFARIQEFTEAYFALFEQTEQQRLGNALDDRFYGLSTPHLATLRQRIAQLTREEVNAAIRRHIVPSRLQVAMIAPDAAALADGIVKGDPSPISYNVEKPAAILEEDKAIASHPFRLTKEQVNVIPLARLFQ